ncbi:MAG: hypothetical protein V7785_00560 [Bermanella sp.]
MKKLTTTFLLFALVGCSAPYQKPQSGDTAILMLPEIDGSSTRTFHIGKLDGNGCAIRPSRVKEESYSQKGLVHVPAGEDFFLSVRSRSNKTFCKGSAAMNLEKDKTYDPIILSFSSYCAIRIIEKTEGEKGKTIDTRPLYSGCIKK